MLNGTVEWFETMAPNLTVRAVHAIAFMISMISGFAVLVWITAYFVLGLPDQIERLLAFRDPVQLFANALIVLAASLATLYAALVALSRATAVWAIVRANHFGPTR